jgi:hypothetical protein
MLATVDLDGTAIKDANSANLSAHVDRDAKRWHDRADRYQPNAGYPAARRDAHLHAKPVTLPGRHTGFL